MGDSAQLKLSGVKPDPREDAAVLCRGSGFTPDNELRDGPREGRPPCRPLWVSHPSLFHFRSHSFAADQTELVPPINPILAA